MAFYAIILHYSVICRVKATGFVHFALSIQSRDLNWTKMNGKIWGLCVVVIWLCAGTMLVNLTSIEDTRVLRGDLLTNYSKYIRPVRNQSHTVDVYLYLTIVAIQEFNEVLERFSVVGVFFIYWVDENMIWNETEYSGISSIFMGYNEVWVPEIILTNPSEKLDSYGKKWQMIRFYSSGVSTWNPADLIKATCVLDVRYFPFDVQDCSMEMYAWGYAASEVNLVSVRDDIETSSLREHGTWKVLNTSAFAEEFRGISRITFKIRLKRKPESFIVSIILPILFLSLLNVLVFVLPTESGERVSYAITVLLSIAVFMTIVTDTLPKTSEPMPIISYFLMIDLVKSALISLCTILNMRLFHRNSDKRIPKFLQYVYNSLSCNCRNKVTNDSCSDKTIAQNNTSLGSRENVKENGFVEVCKDHESPMGQGISKSTGKLITWCDISKMVDYVLLVLFLGGTCISFVTFFIITSL